MLSSLVLDEDEEPVQISDRTICFHDSYLIRNKLGAVGASGFYGAQLRGSMGRTVAVKVTDLRESGTSGERQQDAELEVSMLQRCAGSPHVLAMHEAFADLCFFYIVTETCERSLFHLLDSIEDLSEASLKGVLRDMVSGLEAAHAAGVVHRNVRPGSFICARDGATVKLGDFGLATLSCLGEAGLTGQCGALPFRAPEMLREEAYGAAVDMWALGVIAYTLFFGDFPYPEPCGAASGSAPSFLPKKSLRNLEQGEASRVALCLIRRLLARAPAKRPTAQEVLRHNFFNGGITSPQRQCSLRPMLYSAKSIGAFLGPLDVSLTDMDRCLVAMQAGAGSCLSFEAAPATSAPHCCLGEHSASDDSTDAVSSLSSETAGWPPARARQLSSLWDEHMLVTL